MPAIGATVNGVLRDDTTGLIIPNTVVALDFLGHAGQAQQGATGAISPITYQTGGYTVSTNADGEFQFANLPEDSVFNIIVEQYKGAHTTLGANLGDLGNLTLGADFATTPEVAIQNIGDIYATPIDSFDDIAPYVSMVTGVVIGDTSPGVLNDDVDGTAATGGITVHFNEPIDPALVDANSIVVLDNDNQAHVTVDTVTAAADGRSVHFTTATPLAEGSVIYVRLLRVDFQDTSGNALSASAANDAKVDFDTNNTAGGALYVLLQVERYEEPDLSAGAVTITRIEEDILGAQEFPALRGRNAAFADVSNAEADIQQLNSNDNDDSSGGTSGGSDAAARLEALAAATGSAAGVGAPGAVETDTAAFTFTTGESRFYIVKVDGAGSPDKAFSERALTTGASNNGVAAAYNNALEIELDTNFTGDVTMLIDGVEAGDTVVITPLDDFDVEGASASLLLTDTVAPTTVIQNSYGINEQIEAVSPVFGDGGEISGAGGGALGSPYWNITPRLLVPANNGIPVQAGDIWNSLTDGNEADPTTLVDFVDNTTNLGTGQAYSAAAMTAWLSVAANRQRTVGVAFSEDVTLVGTPAFSGTGATLSGFAVQNDTFLNDTSATVNVDLVTVQVSDVIALANTDNGAVLDFAGTVSDESGNTADASYNPRVIVRDVMPPMAQTAVYDGENIIVTFNEPVVPKVGDDLELVGTGGITTIAITSLIESQNTAGTTTLTIPVTIDIDDEVVFNRGTFDHDNDDDGTNVNPTFERKHSVLRFADVEDVNGISWSNWDSGATAVIIPSIIIRDDVPDFEVDENFANFTNGQAGSFTVQYTFTQPVNPMDFGAVTATDTTLTGAAVAGNFTLTSGANIDPGTSGGVFTNSFTVLNLTVGVDAAISTNDTFDANNAAVASTWDSNDTVDPDLETVP